MNNLLEDKVNPVPENEKERLMALKSYKILDTMPEDDLDAITRLATRICHVPIAYISLMDEGRQWFKSKVGFEAWDSLRENSICQYAIMQDDIYEVPDASSNKLFSENPLVKQENGLRFYAGAPLIDPDGFRLGTLCVIDTKPNSLNEDQKESLQLLAKEVVTHLIIRKRSAELESAQETVQKFFDLSLDFMCIANVEGYFIKVSKTFTSVLGYDEKELLGRPFVDFVHPDDVERTIKETERLAQGELTIQFENRYRRLDGKYIWLSWKCMPEKATGFLYASARDITEAKEAEELKLRNLQLEKEKEIAERSGRLKEEFLANMSHEIRTPLNAVIGLSGLLLKKGGLKGKDLEYIQTIQLNSANLFQLVDNILDYSQIESGVIESQTSEFNLKQTVEDAAKSLELLVTEKGLRLNTEIGKEIPERLIGHPEKISQVLLNLISNSIKFTNAGEINVAATLVTLNPNAAVVKFSVSDTGQGIEPGKLDEIFLPFVQGNGSFTRVQGGTGLGLAITKKLIELQGGEIRVNSRPGIGSTFYFTLLFPVPERNQASRESVVRSEIPKAPDGLRVLLVEDNPFNQMVATDTLSDWNSGIVVEVAENGKIAIDKLRKNKYDLVLMDIQMPEMDGHTATRIIRGDFPAPLCNIPIIAMTAHASVKEIEACFQDGMNEYISKPFDPIVLFEKINRVLNKAMAV